MTPSGMEILIKTPATAVAVIVASFIAGSLAAHLLPTVLGTPPTLSYLMGGQPAGSSGLSRERCFRRFG